jgi:hypothetical protein
MAGQSLQAFGAVSLNAYSLLTIRLDEMRGTIREQEPPRPSSRSGTLPDKELSTTAQCRGLEAPKLVSERCGDLDWNVMPMSMFGMWHNSDEREFNVRRELGESSSGLKLELTKGKP